VEQLLPVIVRHYGEPFADPSAIPSFLVCEAARENVTVCSMAMAETSCSAAIRAIVSPTQRFLRVACWERLFRPDYSCLRR